jgi:cytochrome c-type biogenesis protein CcsB
MDPVEAVLFWLAVGAYAFATGGLLHGVVFRNDRAVPRALVLATAGLVLHTAAIVARYRAQGHLPWAGDYENGLAGGWFIMLFSVAAAWRSRPLAALGVGTLPLTLLLMGFGVMRNPTLTPLAASLKSSWLAVHVFFAWLSFGAYALAMAGGMLYGPRERHASAAGGNPVLDRLPSVDRLDELIFRWVVFGFIAHAVMIASGAIWARDLWGSYWSWDPVETWSLVTWLFYGLAIHLRITRGWRGARFARLAALSILGMIISFFGVTFVVQSSNHFFNVR